MGTRSCRTLIFFNDVTNCVKLMIYVALTRIIWLTIFAKFHWLLFDKQTQEIQSNHEAPVKLFIRLKYFPYTQLMLLMTAVILQLEGSKHSNGCSPPYEFISHFVWQFKKICSLLDLIWYLAYVERSHQN
jgi:hypothetical protein